MKTSLKSVITLGVLAAQFVIVPAALSADATGNWIWTAAGRTNSNAQPRENVLSLKADGSRLTGKISAPGADGLPKDTWITNGRVDGDNISFAVVREAGRNSITNFYTARVTPEKLVGKVLSGQGERARERDWEARNNGSRSVAAAVTPPKPGYNEQGYKIVNDTRYKELSADEAEKYLADHPDTVILDLRPPANYAAGHLKGAISLDVTDDANYKNALKPLDKKKRYLIHSISGGYRTVRVFEYFEENGFENAVAIKGGIGAWTAAGKPLSVTPAQLEQLSARNKNLVILDVRTTAERAGGQLAHSINVDSRAPDFREQLARLDRSKTYVVHCVRGLKRTTDSVTALNQLGFTNVLALEGGYEAWVKAGKPVKK
jgi:phage shock protein E